MPILVALMVLCMIYALTCAVAVIIILSHDYLDECPEWVRRGPRWNSTFLAIKAIFV